MEREGRCLNVLVVNGGSSSLKLDWLSLRCESGRWKHFTVAGGRIERFGTVASARFRKGNGKPIDASLPVVDHAGGIQWFLDMLSKSGDSPVRFDAVGHRVVHGGSKFRQSVEVTDGTLRFLAEVSDLAPLHNPGAIAGIEAARKVFGAVQPMVAVFDTAFHQGIPDTAALYAIPRDLAERHAIRRYGFHGIAHESLVLRFSELAGIRSSEAKLVTLQLGNGCSISAIAGGRSIDTSMGFTPLEGLMMGTRSGDLDAGVVTHLARREKLSPEELDDLLNRRSGLRGISGRSGDMRDVLQHSGADPNAALAVEMFCYRARKYLGAYQAILGGVPSIVFGGGIGENQPLIREKILSGMEWCGIRLDSEKNNSVRGTEAAIHSADSEVQVWVIPTDESGLIARECVRVLGLEKSAP